MRSRRHSLTYPAWIQPQCILRSTKLYWRRNWQIYKAIYEMGHTLVEYKEFGTTLTAWSNIKCQTETSGKSKWNKTVWMSIVDRQDMMNAVGFHSVVYPCWPTVCFSLLFEHLILWWKVTEWPSAALNTALEQTAGTDSGIFPLSRCSKIMCAKTWSWWGWGFARCLDCVCVWYSMKQEKCFDLHACCWHTDVKSLAASDLSQITVTCPHV